MKKKLTDLAKENADSSMSCIRTYLIKAYIDGYNKGYLDGKQEGSDEINFKQGYEKGFKEGCEIRNNAVRKLNTLDVNNKKLIN